MTLDRFFITEEKMPAEEFRKRLKKIQPNLSFKKIEQKGIESPAYSSEDDTIDTEKNISLKCLNHPENGNIKDVAGNFITTKKGTSKPISGCEADLWKYKHERGVKTLIKRNWDEMSNKLNSNTDAVAHNGEWKLLYKDNGRAYYENNHFKIKIKDYSGLSKYAVVYCKKSLDENQKPKPFSVILSKFIKDQRCRVCEISPNVSLAEEYANKYLSNVIGNFVRNYNSNKNTENIDWEVQFKPKYNLGIQSRTGKRLLDADLFITFKSGPEIKLKDKTLSGAAIMIDGPTHYFNLNNNGKKAREANAANLQNDIIRHENNENFVVFNFNVKTFDAKEEIELKAWLDRKVIGLENLLLYNVGKTPTTENDISGVKNSDKSFYNKKRYETVLKYKDREYTTKTGIQKKLGDFLVSKTGKESYKKSPYEWANIADVDSGIDSVNNKKRFDAFVKTMQDKNLLDSLLLRLKKGEENL